MRRPLTALVLLALLALLAAPAAAQFHLLDWTLQDDSGDGFTTLSPDTMWLAANWPTLGGGALLVYKAVAPVDGTLTADMAYMGFDGVCNQSVPVFVVDGVTSILTTSCGGIQPIELSVSAGQEFGLGLITFDGTWPGVVTFTHFGFEPSPPVQVWTDLGQGLAGSAGASSLQGVALLYPMTPFALEVTGALPLRPVAFVIGLSELGAPFKGGVLVPSPDLVLAGFLTDATGAASLAAAWPAGIPAGLSLYAQAWQSDFGTPSGWASTNGLRALVP